MPRARREPQSTVTYYLAAPRLVKKCVKLCGNLFEVTCVFEKNRLLRFSDWTVRSFRFHLFHLISSVAMQRGLKLTTWYFGTFVNMSSLVPRSCFKKTNPWSLPKECNKIYYHLHSTIRCDPFLKQQTLNICFQYNILDAIWWFVCFCPWKHKKDRIVLQIYVQGRCFNVLRNSLANHTISITSNSSITNCAKGTSSRLSLKQ